MRLFLKYLRDFLKEDFNLKYYLTVGVFLAIAVTINYRIDLEDGILDQIRGFFPRTAGFFLLYGGLHVSTIVINRYCNGGKSFLTKGRFWLSLTVGILVLSADVAFQPSKIITTLPPEIRIFGIKVLNNLISLFSNLVPLYIFYRLLDKDQSSFYGLQGEGFVVKPYFKLFSIIIPLAVAGSFLPGFQQQYPMYISTNAHQFWNLPEWVTVAVYELAYGWNFLSVELLFRGFLVIGLLKYLGRHAIIPMVVVYCSLHFGKPLGECVSSIFGGYILGVIAYYSRNIWGGVVIHVGLAWLMEIVSAIHKTVF